MTYILVLLKIRITPHYDKVLLARPCELPKQLEFDELLRVELALFYTGCSSGRGNLVEVHAMLWSEIACMYGRSP